MRTLLIDIETFPLTILAWTTYEANALAVKEYSKVCSYSIRWLGGERITKALPDYGSITSDRKLVVDLWKLLDEADVIIAHNADGFDMPRLNARFAFYGLNPPSPYKTIDTLKIARRVFGFPSNKLDDLCQYLNIGKKIRHDGFDLWQRCMDNEQVAWTKMKTYNEHDVVLLQALYIKLLPWIDNHPNISKDLKGCPKCGSEQLQSRGTSRTLTRQYKRWQCQDCGGWAKSVKSEAAATIRNA